MPTTDQILSWRGRQLFDRDGQKVGKIDEIYLDTTTNEPEWALVNTGLFGTKSTFVPLRGATLEGDELRVSHDKSLIKDAPGVEVDGELSHDEEAQLYRHYSLEYTGDSGAGTEVTGDRHATRDVEVEGRDRDADLAVTGRGRAGAGDDAITRSEEELRVGTATREAGRVRLRKYVETENVTTTVPVSREEVRIEREEITDANRDQALAGPDITESEHEVILHEEEPVVEKRVVPKERVRLGTDTVTEQREVSDEVRRERIDVDEAARDDVR